MVSDYVGPKQISSAGHLLLKNAKLLGEVAASLVGIIESVHQRGFIHGNIHSGNVLYHGDDNILNTLSLIDFDRAEEFILPSGEHVAESHKEYADGWSLEMLSPFELEGWRKTRRDDMYRIVEMLLLTNDGKFLFWRFSAWL